MPPPQVFIEPDGVLYRPDENGQNRIIPATSLTDISSGWWPPALRTREGEYCFVPATMMRELADFAEANRVPFVERDDVWSWLLEPFLDTELSPENSERVLTVLAKSGFPREEVLELRAKLEEPMLKLTALTWEWQYYGLADVLTAMRGERGFAAFRLQAFAIADRAMTKPATREDFLRFAPK